MRLLAAVLIATLPALAQVRSFRVDTNHTVLGFKASTLLFDVPGRFDQYQADIKGDPMTLEGVSIRLEIEAKSINTANRTRDEHLRNPDFFDVAKSPRIIFQSSQARREGDRVLVKGTLTMHGVSRELEIPFLATEGRNGAGLPTWAYRGSLQLDRSAFNLGTDSVAAKISLKKDVELNLMLVGFFEESLPQAMKPQLHPKRKR